MDELSLEIVLQIFVVAFLEESGEVDDVSLLIGYVDDVMCHLLMGHLSLIIRHLGSIFIIPSMVTMFSMAA